VYDDVGRAHPAALWELSSDLFCVIDSDARFVRVNPAWGRVLGWDTDELAGRAVTEVMHPEDTEALGSTQAETRWLCHDGSYRWLLWSTVPNGDGRYGIGVDITRRRQVEWELRTSNAQLNAIVENTGAAIYVKRKGDFRYLLANPEFERLLGIEVGTGVGLRDEDVLAPEAVELVRRADHRVLDEGIEISHEEEIPVGGVLLTYATRKFPLRDETGEPYAVCGISTDITESRRREVELEERLRWGKRIRGAVNDGELLVYAQPIIDLRDRSVVQEELLVRLRSQEFLAPVLPPAEFLPAAERFGLVGEIDRFMVHRGIGLAATGRSVEINLSGQSIGDRALTREIERELRATGAEPSRLVFEITETAAIQDIDAARAFSTRIARLGCACALDDFGTGFGSLTYLRHLAVQFLKIDISFVRGLTESVADQQVIRSIVQLARDHGQETVAEGVEDEATLELLDSLGVGYAQGFHIGRPKPVAPGP
jgi:PAS domain S-box-containing protein